MSIDTQNLHPWGSLHETKQRWLLWNPRHFLTPVAKQELLWQVYLGALFCLPFTPSPSDPRQDHAQLDKGRLSLSCCHGQEEPTGFPGTQMANTPRWPPHGHCQTPTTAGQPQLHLAEAKEYFCRTKRTQVLQGCTRDLSSTLSAFSAVFSWQMADCDTTTASPV